MNDTLDDLTESLPIIYRPSLHAPSFNL